MSPHCVRLGLVVQLSVWLAYLGPGVPVVQGGLDRSCGYTLRQNHVRRGVCGSNLAELLRLVCTMHGLGYSGTTRSARKRRDVSSYDQPDASNDLSHGLSRHLLSTREARAFLHKRNAGQRGLICECCTHRCSMKELVEYCGPVQQPQPRPQMDFTRDRNTHSSNHRHRTGPPPSTARKHHIKPFRVLS